MPELFSNANLATVQKTYEALNGDSLKERKGSNPFVTLNPESFSAEYSFKNEYERDKYLVSLTSQDLQKAIDWLQSEKGGKDMSNVDGGLSSQQMIDFLTGKKGDLEEIQQKAKDNLEKLKQSLLSIPSISRIKNFFTGGNKNAPAPAGDTPATATVDTLINTPADAPTDAPADAPTDAPAGDAPAREQTTTPLKNKETQKNYTDISNALSNRKNVIPQVSKNAQKIADKLKRAKNQDVVKGALATLLNPSKSNSDFQKALGMSHREADGIIGPKTINKLMEKADSDFKLDVPHQNKAKNVTSKATAAKTAAPKATPDVSAAKAAAPKDTAPKAAAPKIEKSSASIEWINSDALKQSISDFNTYCSSHPLLKDRIIQDPDGKARWVDNKDNTFSLIITPKGEVKGYIEWSRKNFTEFELSLIKYLNDMVAKNKLTYPNSRPTVAPAKAVEIGNEKSIIKEAMDFMERRLNDGNFENDFTELDTMKYEKEIIKDPFNKVFFSFEKWGDLQMTDKKGIFSYRDILTGANLDAWRKKLSSEQKNAIIEQLNQKWNERAQTKLNKPYPTIKKDVSAPAREQTTTPLKNKKTTAKQGEPTRAHTGALSGAPRTGNLSGNSMPREGTLSTQTNAETGSLTTDSQINTQAQVNVQVKQ